MLWRQMEMTRAYENLYDPKASGELDMEAYFELCKRAGYSEEQALKAAQIRGNQRLDLGLEA